MSKPVKKLLTDTYRRKFADTSEAMLIDIRGVAAGDNNKLRTELAGKQVRITVVKNSLAKVALADTKLQPLTPLIEGPTAVVYGGSVINIARDLIGWAKKIEKLQLKGAILDGTVFGPDEVERLSKYPTREEAQAQVVQLLLSPGKNLAGAITGPGRKLASILKTIQEKLEKGEAIAKVA